LKNISEIFKLEMEEGIFHMFYLSSLAIFDDGNNIKTNIDIQIVIGNKIINGSDKELDLFSFQELGGITKIRGAPGFYFHYGKNAFLSSYNIHFSSLVTEIPRYYFVTLLKKMGYCHFLSLFSEFIVVRHT